MHTPFYSSDSEEEIGFSPSEPVTDRFMQEQPLVITALALGTDIRRVIIDKGEGCDVLFYCFKCMGLIYAHLTPSYVKLEGFTTHLVAVKVMVELAKTIGEG